VKCHGLCQDRVLTCACNKSHIRHANVAYAPLPVREIDGLTLPVVQHCDQDLILAKAHVRFSPRPSRKSTRLVLTYRPPNSNPSHTGQPHLPLPFWPTNLTSVPARRFFQRTLTRMRICCPIGPETSMSEPLRTLTRTRIC
jgi:hypothetical protein